MSESDEPRQVNKLVQRVVSAILQSLIEGDEVGVLDPETEPMDEIVALDGRWDLKDVAGAVIPIVLEAAATLVDECNREGAYQAIGAADRIRALGIER